ncbi:replication-associated recombination protein A [Thioalkalivibrio halophilus]|uniref:Replication-associated recombination protein A n=1 Tax=Thioalkalivibrio halophilus TaxID=252474 RepID=A0A1V3A000_9GAMM|nr:replication-associated recombination protein A [Thioalkalivibrio halophilus]OOC10687.1 recombination factor protein RarA [Thioalkalivibrio halophilus]
MSDDLFDNDLFGDDPAGGPEADPPAQPSSQSAAAVTTVDPAAPLAERMRPARLDEMVGQDHLVGADAALRRAIESGQTPSMILWGPPGCGKTTLARLVAEAGAQRLVTLSAVLAGVKDVRAVVDAAKTRRRNGVGTLLFIDEIHRFNKGQQDALLPHIEDGTLTFVGATTENPSFALNSALLSRARVYRMESVGEAAIEDLIGRALADAERGLGGRGLSLADEERRRLAGAADGDARRALNWLETASDLASDGVITGEALRAVMGAQSLAMDRQGDAFYDQISALHKSVRGSDPDGALYWLVRMLDAGCDPDYLGRRLLRMAYEDIGLGAVGLGQRVLAAWQTMERLGRPEGDLALVQAAVELAGAPKSNSTYAALGQARAAIAETGSPEVPLHLRNAPTELMRQEGFGAGYRYDHDEPDGVARGQTYLPELLLDRRFYTPKRAGTERVLAERLDALRGDGRDDGSGDLGV